MRNEISFRGQALQFATKADFIYHMAPAAPIRSISCSRSLAIKACNAEIARVIANGANSPQAREAVSRWFGGRQTPTGDQILAVQEFFAAKISRNLRANSGE
jgi:hypothetical protein